MRLEHFKTATKKKWRQQKCGSHGECYQSHQLQINQTKQCYEKLTYQDHSKIEYANSRQPFFQSYDEKRETGLFYGNWNDQRKTHQGKTVRKDTE